MLETLNDPPRLHAAIVHFPVVLAFIGVPLMLALIATRGRSCTLRWLLVALYVVGSVGGFVAMQVGGRAEDKLSELSANGPGLTHAAHEELEEHEEMGEKLWWMMLLPAGAVALGAVKRTPVRVIALVLALGLGVLAATLAGLTAHRGGTLVYAHGVGVPASPNNYPAKP
ncbi:MAG: hypothetical protein K8S99_00455 [Planctomycetes bacterium]|nr:hypothetical protein [Planctomycetota bacterium]